MLKKVLDEKLANEPLSPRSSRAVRSRSNSGSGPAVLQRSRSNSGCIPPNGDGGACGGAVGGGEGAAGGTEDGLIEEVLPQWEEDESDEEEEERKILQVWSLWTSMLESGNSVEHQLAKMLSESSNPVETAKYLIYAIFWNEFRDLQRHRTDFGVRIDRGNIFGHWLQDFAAEYLSNNNSTALVAAGSSGEPSLAVLYKQPPLFSACENGLTALASLMGMTQEMYKQNQVLLKAIQESMLDLMNQENLNYRELLVTKLRLRQSSIKESGESKNTQKSKGPKVPKTVHALDGFVFESTEQFESLTQSKLSAGQCNSCNSTNTQALALVSHSCSYEGLLDLFYLRLPDLKGLKVVDVGCGLGAILYGAFYMSNAIKIYGVDTNERFCSLAEKIAVKYGMTRRVRVRHGDIFKNQDLLKICDVVIINNSFEHFVSDFNQAAIWHAIMSCARIGTKIVTNPSLSELLKQIPNEKAIQKAWPAWVSEDTLCDSKLVANFVLPKKERVETFHVYTVKKRPFARMRCTAKPVKAK